MTYRATEFCWTPSSASAWRTFTACRKESARLWSDLVEHHHATRAQKLPWPRKPDLEKAAKKKYPDLHSQSVQQTIGEFCEAVASASALRKQGQNAKFPWRKPNYRDVTYTNQAAIIRDGYLLLPNGKAGKLKVRLPKGLAIPGRLMEVRLSFGRICLITEVADVAQEQGVVIGVDLGVNSVIAATDGKTALVLSGRELKATVQWRNKRLASLQEARAKTTKGSRKNRRLNKRKYMLLDKAKRRVKDCVHKATHQVAAAFPNAKCYVGKAFNGAAQKMGRKQAQQVSQAATGKVTTLLDYKTSGAIVIGEAYSSQTCPVCGELSVHRRTYRCPKCKTELPRDVVGALNILSKGVTGAFQKYQSLPKVVFKYPGKFPGSSSGHLASSLRKSRSRRPLGHAECH